MGRVIFTYIKEEVERLVEDVLEFEDDDTFDFLLDEIAKTLPRNVMYEDYITSMSRWYFILKQTLVLEDYLLANRINKAIKIEENNFISTIRRNCTWYNRKEDQETINQITLEMRETYNL